MLQRLSTARRTGDSTEHDEFPAEVRQDLQPPAKRLNIAGQGTDLGRAGLGALDGRHPFLPHPHPAGELLTDASTYAYYHSELVGQQGH